ncbi:transglycosylase family protein [Streptomyces sp. MZ04]|uniref:LysM peptidoglycan-binding domain-containing protein n=1 Tax=Streptomyces sp. MZ04 TaxID=2559236 RepID=UPI00107E7714|nr:transglycosylase family protein [Streptomyces sp. MZ04]TGB14142.1 LysM peptidoglycan-binding domain-containing protein [Streptomyces sp. MZ04]
MLFSGKGKHRRPSKATRVATLAGVTGVAVAAPLMAAGSASAATGSEWDSVAQCEAGGNWSINTGNGYYGGLQFSASTWAAYGGTQYAATADQASKAQQIEIGEKVLAGQGKGAWPSCGVGLSGASYEGGGTQEAAPQQETQEPQSQPSAQTEQPAAPKAEAPKPAPKAESKKTVETPTGKKVKKGDGEYKVKKGDTLSKIADEHDVKGGWHKVYKLNGDIIDNADMIFPGQQLHLS